MTDYQLPFTGKFAEAWQEWLEYRKEKKLPKYVPRGIKMTFTELINLSNNNEETAIKMLERAMCNNWQGFNFKLPENGQQNSSTGHKAIGADLKYDRP